MPICPGDPGYPAKPSYAIFASGDILSNATDAAHTLGVSIAFILCQWYQEWGIPINNPAFQTSIFSQCTQGSCGAFPIFCSLSDGKNAYVAQINYSYKGGADPYTNVFGDPVDIWASYNWGFRGEQTATCKDDSGGYYSVTSQHFYGAIESAGSGTTGTYAANEAIGASPWNAGHYYRYSYGDTYPGRRLNVILNDSGWAPQYCYVP